MRNPLLALALFVPGAACGRPAAPWNVVLITLDTTRADRLSCYDPERGHTPSLDALAAEGTRFDLAQSTASVTPVSHAAILTGLYNHEHGLRVLYAGGGYRLDEEAATLATVLRSRGYHTLAVHSAFPVSRFFGLERGFDVFEDFQARMNEHADGFRWNMRSNQRRSDATTDLVAQLAVSEPFFLWVHYWDPHDSIELPPDVRPGGAPQDPGAQPLYTQEVSFMDAQIGRLLGDLRARGLYEETLVVVVADHGQGLMDHGWALHRLLYQEQVRVPLIVRVPGGRGVPEVRELVRTIDIYPTVLDYLGLELPRPVSGRSLRPLIEGRPDEPRTALADQINGYDWNARDVRARELDDFLYSAMDREWKLIYRPLHFARSELFFLPEDPREEHDLFSQRPEEARRLLELLAEAAPWVTAPFTAAEDGLQDEVQRALSDLGYAGSEPLDTQWTWTCPRHLEQRWNARVPCPACGAPPLLIGR